MKNDTPGNNPYGLYFSNKESAQEHLETLSDHNDVIIFETICAPCEFEKKIKITIK